MANNIPLIVFPTKDLEKAKKFFNTFLDGEPYAENAYYVGYKVGNTEVGLDPNGKAVIAYIDVQDIQASLKTLQATGASTVMEPKDVGGGIMVAQVQVEDTVLGLRQKPSQS